MMNKSKLRQALLAVCLVGLSSPARAAAAGDKKPYWQDIQTGSVNRDRP